MATVTQNKYFIRIDEYPFTVAKIMRFKNQEQADDFKALPVEYVKLQVPGFRIFLIHAGFVDKPTEHICDDVIGNQIEQMVNWYAKNKVSNKRERNYYQIK